MAQLDFDVQIYDASSKSPARQGFEKFFLKKPDELS